MVKGSKLMVPAALAVGAALGWAAASGWFDPAPRAEASVSRPTPAPAAGAARSDGLDPAAVAAVAAHNRTVQVKARQEGKKPNILVIWGDDIGVWNVSAYSRGMMGYRTPNIDRIAKEGAIFTDHYGQQSCTAGRAAFITGQSCFRTGLLKVGLPGAKEGLSEKDPTLADLLKP